MKYLLLLVAFCLFSFVPTQNSDVYICVSKTAKKFHFAKNCTGLQQCTHTIKKISKSDATQQGYTVCLLER